MYLCIVFCEDLAEEGVKNIVALGFVTKKKRERDIHIACKKT